MNNLLNNNNNNSSIVIKYKSSPVVNEEDALDFSDIKLNSNTNFSNVWKVNMAIILLNVKL